MQAIIANPKTDHRLGKVGRWSHTPWWTAWNTTGRLVFKRAVVLWINYIFFFFFFGWRFLCCALDLKAQMFLDMWRKFELHHHINSLFTFSEHRQFPVTGLGMEGVAFGQQGFCVCVCVWLFLSMENEIKLQRHVCIHINYMNEKIGCFLIYLFNSQRPVNFNAS